MASTPTATTAGRAPRRTGTRRRIALLVVPALLLAGCATTVSGSAQPQDVLSLASRQPTPGPIATPPATTEPSTPESAPSASSESSPVTTDSDPTGEPGVPTSSEPSGPATSPTPSGTSSSAPAHTEDEYPTGPRNLITHPRSDDQAALLESRRLSAYVPVPTSIDERFTEGGNISTQPLRGPSALGLLFSDPVPAVAKRAGMYAGFSSARGTESGDASLLTAAFVLADAKAAAKAVDSLAAASKDDGDSDLAVPHHPKAAGSLGTVGDDVASAQAFQAVGPVVAYAYARAPLADKKTLPATVDRALSALSDSLEDYSPTPKDELDSLLIDPDGLLARTLPSRSGEGTVIIGAWPAKGFVHYMIDVPASRSLFDRAGVDAVASDRSTVYRAADAEGATDVYHSFLDEVAEKYPDMSAADPPGDVPDTGCLENTLNATYYCAGAVDRYVFEYWAESQQDMDRSVAAQREMLTP